MRLIKIIIKEENQFITKSIAKAGRTKHGLTQNKGRVKVQ